MDTWLLEFRLKKEFMMKNKEFIIAVIEKLVKRYFDGYALEYKSLKNRITALLVGKSATTILLQGKEDGLLTVDVNVRNEEIFKEKISEFEKAVRQQKFYEKPRTTEYQPLPPLKRGREFSVYDGCDSGSFAERDFDRVVFDQVSPYQHIRIMHSTQYGNCLFLDNDLNLAESDLEYTRAITGYEQEDYEGKTVLILGGGDGGILHYLRDRGPSMITLIDIDQMVIDAAKIHLRGICHDALDSLSGKNYEIIVDDCVKYLTKYKKEGRKFDYVINDLTGVPISADPVNGETGLGFTIFSHSVDVLKDDGKYFGYGGSPLDKDGVIAFENQLQKLDQPLKFEKRAVCVPSYMEVWFFYKIWKDL